MAANYAEPTPYAEWAIRGLGGAIVLLARQIDAGLPYNPEQIARLREYSAQIDRAIATQERMLMERGG